MLFIDAGVHFSTNPDGLSRYTVEMIRSLTSKNRTSFQFVERRGMEYFVLGSDSKKSSARMLDVVQEKDVLFLPGLDVGISDAFTQLSALKQKGVKIYSLLADIIGIENPEFFPLGNDRNLLEYFGNLNVICDALVVPSNHVKNRLILFQLRNGLNFPEIVIGYPGNDHLERIEADQVKFDYPYLLYVSTIEPRKQHLKLIDAFLLSSLPEKGYKLHLIGKMGWLNPRERRVFESLVRSPSVKHFSNANDSLLKGQMLESQALIMCSLDEGYGLSLMEAAFLNKPILCSDIKVFREITDGKATFFDPTCVNLTESLNNFVANLEQGTQVEPPTQIARSRTWDALTDVWIGLLNPQS